ncbi:MAG TPA: hypothetical protein PKE04_20490, partial [Clostridia bacterium]|nr:hypothetical protein [Clostridia bacterium]
ALTPPTVSSDARLLAGSYDLYSPRTEALKARYNLHNPILDAVDRDDVIYVDISGANLAIIANRLYDAYGVIIQVDVPTADGEQLINESSQHRMQLYRIISKTQEEYDQIMAEEKERVEREAEIAKQISEATGDEVTRIIAYGPSPEPSAEATASPTPPPSPSPAPTQP